MHDVPAGAAMQRGSQRSTWRAADELAAVLDRGLKAAGRPESYAGIALGGHVDGRHVGPWPLGVRREPGRRSAPVVGTGRPGDRRECRTPSLPGPRLRRPVELAVRPAVPAASPGSSRGSSPRTTTRDGATSRTLAERIAPSVAPAQFDGGVGARVASTSSVTRCDGIVARYAVAGVTASTRRRVRRPMASPHEGAPLARIGPRARRPASLVRRRTVEAAVGHARGDLPARFVADFSNLDLIVPARAAMITEPACGP